MKRLLALALLLGACNPLLVAESPAPPGRSARLDPVLSGWGFVQSYRMELSQGAALALSCEDGATCEHVTAKSDNPAVAEVRLASFGVLRSPGLYGRPSEAQTAAALVVIGHAPGATHVHVHARQGDRDVAVTVIPQPGASSR